ncbi:MAG: hypothetical protein F6J87_18000 [Spirulina sp. SIO3F2]|nr:hypothetical protein [Spirulina sp. SIO3F2]
MMNPAQQATLKAFVLAVAQLEPPIAPEVNAVLTTINQDLKTQPDRALDSINHLVENHAQLGELHEKARQELHRYYSGKERDKFKIAGFGTANPQPTPITKQPLCRLSNEFAAIAQMSAEQLNDPQDAFPQMLQMRCAVAVEKVRLLDFAVLRAIEKRPLTTEDLAYRLERPFAHVGQVIEQLWQARKIDTMGSGTLQKMLPFLRSHHQPNPDAYWMLTSLGYFALHPIISLRHMGV